MIKSKDTLKKKKKLKKFAVLSKVDSVHPTVHRGSQRLQKEKYLIHNYNLIFCSTFCVDALLCNMLLKAVAHIFKLMNMIFTPIGIYHQTSFWVIILKWQGHPKLKIASIAIES